MAGELKKISALTQGTPEETDVIPYVDLNTNTTKKALKSELKGADGTNGTNGTDGESFVWKGAYSAGTTYAPNDAVSYSGSSYMCKLASTGNLPTDGTYWDLMAQKGSDGAGSGDVVGPASAVGDNIVVFNSTTGKLIKDGGVKVADLVSKSTYDANSILYATDDNTPVALNVGTNTVIGRINGGITTLAIDSDLSSTSAGDDSVPSAKATKAMGDLKLPLAGGTMTGNITLGENTSIDLDPSLSADGKYTGTCITGTAGATLAFGDVCYLNNDDSRWELADANLSDGYDKLLGMCVLAANADGDATKMLLMGNIRADAAFPTLTPGKPVYLSETAGDITETQPTTADVSIRILGFSLTADSIIFNPSVNQIIHT